MASAVRTLRQARSAKLSYTDSLPEDEDEVYNEYPDGYFPPEAIAMLASAKPSESRRNLALKKISKCKERDNPKERAEAALIQRAIKESLTQDRARSSDATEIAIVDSEDDTPVATPDAITEAEADVVSAPAFELSCKQTEGNHGEAEQIQQDTKKKTAQQNKKNIENDLELSDGDDEEYEEDEDDVDSEDEYSDFSDDSGCKRKRNSKSQQKKGKNSVDRERKNVKSNLPVKKPRTTKPTSKLKSSTTVTSSSQVGMKSGLQAKPTSVKENVSINGLHSTDKAKRKPAKALMVDKTTIGMATPLLKSLETPLKFQKTPSTKTSPLGITSPESSVIFNLQSPTLVHRRVIGLSRRFRPPPLHPYLSKMET